MPSAVDAAAAWARPRLRLVGSGALAGAVGGALVLAAVVAATGDGKFAQDQTFALGALAFGFGVLGWSGSAFAGRGIENLQRHLGTGSDWSEADSRRAMARIVGFGAGMMLVVPALAPLT